MSTQENDTGRRDEVKCFGRSVDQEIRKFLVKYICVAGAAMGRVHGGLRPPEESPVEKAALVPMDVVRLD